MFGVHMNGGVISEPCDKGTILHVMVIFLQFFFQNFMEQ